MYSFSTLFPTLCCLAACTILVHLALNCQPPMHDRTPCPDVWCCFVFLKVSMNSFPKRPTRLIGPVDWIFAHVQPSRANDYILLWIKILCPLSQPFCSAPLNTLTCLHVKFFNSNRKISIFLSFLCHRYREVIQPSNMIINSRQHICPKSTSFHHNYFKINTDA